MDVPVSKKKLEWIRDLIICPLFIKSDSGIWKLKNPLSGWMKRNQDGKRKSEILNYISGV